MNTKLFTRKNVPELLVAGALITASALSSVWAADAVKDRGAQWAQHRQEWVRAKLDRDANRLEIKASQQTAWQSYASARMAFADRSMVRPAPDADAAAIAKLRADRAAEAARKLATLADATAKLESVLSPEQRKTLDQIARGHHHHRHHQGMRHHRRDEMEGGGQKNAADPGQSEEAPSV